MDWELVGEGATTKVYRDGSRAIKLYVGAAPVAVEREARHQSFAAQAGLPVPRVFGVQKLNNTLTALEMDYISGTPLMREEMDEDARRAAVRTLVKLQCAVHAISAEGLPNQAEKLSRKIAHSAFVSRSIKDDLLSQLRDFDVSMNRLCHGDFHPLNVLFDGHTHWIIDWVDATSGNPLADACRTYLILRQNMARWSGVYLDLFCGEAGAARADVLAWLPIIAAARTAENVDALSRAALLDICQNEAGRPR